MTGDKDEIQLSKEILYIMKAILSLFALLFHPPSPSPPSPQVLNIIENCAVDLFDTDFSGGMDLRPQQKMEPTIQTLQYIHERHKLYMWLTDYNMPFPIKEMLAREYLDEDSIVAPNVYKGNLLDDWEFDIHTKF